MSRQHMKRGRSGTRGRYVELPFWIMRSNAWRRLTPVERCTWLELTSFYNGTNNGYLAAPNRLIGERLNVAHTTVGRALATLIMLGFVEVTKRSSFSAKNRAATEYRLTHVKCDRTGVLPTKQFMRLGTVTDATVARQSCDTAATVSVTERSPSLREASRVFSPPPVRQ